MKKWFTDKIKIWKVMKICAMQAMIAMILAGVSMAHSTNGQLLDTKISLNLREVSIEDALKEIERVAKVKFVYSEDQLGLKGAITLVAENRDLESVLNDLLTPHKIKFKVHEKEATITLKKQTAVKESLIRGTDSNEAAPRVSLVTGRVTDAANSQPLAGVNIIIKGTTSGTTSDVDGKFSIQANEDDNLIFSFIGYASFETKVNGRSVIDVVLQEDTKNLNDVVVNAGYWTVKEKEQTGNIARVTADEIKTQPVSNPLQAMAGRMAGVMVTQETGVAGGGIKVQIRGTNSIASGNDPLYIIDGMPVSSSSLKSSLFGGTLASGNPFSSINPNDIESIEVLKDGAATAIYGSRGANGVILITTKKGTTGKTKVDLSFSTGISQVANRINLLNTPDYLAMRREAHKNDAKLPAETTAYDLLLWDSTRYTDWQKELIGNTAHTTNLNASISGGDKNTQFLFSTGYYKESTVFPGDFGFKKGTGSFNLNHKSTNERLAVGLAVNYQLEDNNLLAGDLTNSALSVPPNAPEPYINGALNWGPLQRFANPYAALLAKYTVKTNNLRLNTRVDYKLLAGLTLKVNLGYTQIQTDSYSSTPNASINPRLGITTGTAYFGYGKNSSWIAEPQIEYKKNFSNSAVNVLLGTTFQQSDRYTSTIIGSGYTNDLLLNNLQAAPIIAVQDLANTQYLYNAFFGRINYTLAQKYIFDVVGRRDGSSRFGTNNRFANFGSLSGAWIFSNEGFVKQNLRFLSFGKLRASYGTSGNDQIGDYGYLDTYSTATYPYQNISPLSPTRLANPNYSWEANKKIEAGLEIGIKEDKLLFTVSYYRNRSSNQLVGLPLSGVTGFTSVQANLPATVENTGWEIEINSLNLKLDNFSWTSNFNLTLPRNKLVEFPNLESSAYANRYIVGESINIERVYAYRGVDPQTGVYQFQDVDGNKAITSPMDNQTVINLAPSFFGGIGNTLKYKNLTLNFLFQFVQQKGISYLIPFDMPGFVHNQPAEVMARWRNPGDQALIERFSQTAGSTYTSYQNAIRSEHNYEDASFVRLKNISLSYQLPSKWMEKIHSGGSEIFVQSQNLVTITKYKGLDPETRNSSVLPPLRMVTVGLRITF